MTKVLIATNEPVLARGFAAILSEGGLEVVDVCSDLPHLFDSLLRHRPDVAILDMAVTPVLTAIVDMRKVAPRCQILIWPRQIVEKDAREILKLGAHGVLPSTVTPGALIDTLNLLGTFPSSEPAPAALVKHVCNPTERKIISLIGCGMRNEEIAALVRSDIHTVDQQVKTLSRRFGAQDRYELALYGLSISNEATSS